MAAWVSSASHGSVLYFLLCGGLLPLYSFFLVLGEWSFEVGPQWSASRSPTTLLGFITGTSPPFCPGGPAFPMLSWHGTEEYDGSRMLLLSGIISSAFCACVFYLWSLVQSRPWGVGVQKMSPFLLFYFYSFLLWSFYVFVVDGTLKSVLFAFIYSVARWCSKHSSPRRHPAECRRVLSSNTRDFIEIWRISQWLVSTVTLFSVQKLLFLILDISEILIPNFNKLVLIRRIPFLMLVARVC